MNNCKNCNKQVKSKYCNNKCQAEYENKKRYEDFFNDKYVGKRLLYAKGRWNRTLLEETLGLKCNSCGLEKWNNSPITLEVNHIDGKAYNNTINNLEFLCPNCHSQTDTFKNKGARSSDRTYR